MASQKKVKFKRPRSRRACLTCRQRKVKCDVDSTYPNKCTNCIQFGIEECVVPNTKGSGGSAAGASAGGPQSEHADHKADLIYLTGVSQQQQQQPLHHNHNDKHSRSHYQDQQTVKTEPHGDHSSRSNTGVTGGASTGVSKRSGAALQKKSSKHRRSSSHGHGPHMTFSKPLQPLVASPARIDNPPALSEQFQQRLSAFKLDPNEALPLIDVSAVRDYLLPMHTTRFFKDAATDYVREAMATANITRAPLDQVATTMLNCAGVFNLPEEGLVWHYIDLYFKCIHPMVPILSRVQFMHDYQDLNHPPSLLLLQTVIFVGATASFDPTWPEEKIAEHAAVLDLLRWRVKALYDSDSETKPLALVQSLTLFIFSSPVGIFSSRTTYHWIHLALTTMKINHLDQDPTHNHDLSPIDKRLAKRAYWLLCVMDHCVSMCLGLKFSEIMCKSEMPRLTDEDLDEYDPDGSFSAIQLSPSQRVFFQGNVRLCYAMDEICVDAEKFYPGATTASLYTKYINILKEAHDGFPPVAMVNYDNHSTWNIYNASLAVFYESLVIIVCRGCMIGVKNGVRVPGSNDDTEAWRQIEQSARNIVTILEQMAMEVCKIPLLCYSVSRVAVMLLVQLQNTDPTEHDRAVHDLRVCLKFLKSSRGWPSSEFCAYVIENIYSDRKKLFGLLESILPEDEFRMLAPPEYFRDRADSLNSSGTPSPTSGDSNSIAPTSPHDTAGWVMDCVDKSWSGTPIPATTNQTSSSWLYPKRKNSISGVNAVPRSQSVMVSDWFNVFLNP